MTRYTVAVDDTVAGWKTVEWVDENVDADTDHVRLLTVSEFYGESLSRSEYRLLEAESRLRHHHPGLDVASDVTGGPTADRLVFDGAKSDVLVIGGNQAHRFGAAVTGRVGERVVAHAVTPVVVVPEEWDHADGPVVVGIDSRTAASALAFASDAAARQRRELVLVRAWEAPADVSPYGLVYVAADRELWEHEGELELQAAVRAVGARHPELSVRGKRHHGHADDALLRESGTASLIVVGRRHHTAIGAFLLGSVGERLMHDAHTPVCVVPPMFVAAGGPDARTAASASAPAQAN